MPNAPTKRWVVWVNDGPNGWFPNDFNTLTEAMKFAQSGLSLPWCVTELRELHVQVPQETKTEDKSDCPF